MGQQIKTPEQFVDAFTQMYENSEWKGDLLPLIKHENFTKVCQALIDLATGIEPGVIPFSPPPRLIFEPFNATSKSNLKVVILNRSAQGDPNMNDGLALSGYEVNPDAKIFTDALPRDPEAAPEKNLRYLAKQGVLLLNTAVTAKTNEPVAHAKLWGPLILNLLKKLANDTPNLIFVLIGPDLEPFAQIIPKNCYVMTLPAITPDWDYLDVFNTINQILRNTKKDVINW